jgi:hypothetical protein
MENDSYPCICGHNYYTHQAKYGNFYGICKLFLWCNCRKFKPDNLRYLEQKAEETKCIY